jgi:hypothetical protein
MRQKIPRASHVLGYTVFVMVWCFIALAIAWQHRNEPARSLAWIGRIKNMIMGRKPDKLHICPSAKATLANPPRHYYPPRTPLEFEMRF